MSRGARPRAWQVHLDRGHDAHGKPFARVEVYPRGRRHPAFPAKRNRALKRRAAFEHKHRVEVYSCGQTTQLVRYRRGLSSLALVQQEDSHADFKLNACPGSRTLPKEEQQAFLDALSLLTPMRDPQQDFSPGYPILSQYLSMIPWDTCD